MVCPVMKAASSLVSNYRVPTRSSASSVLLIACTLAACARHSSKADVLLSARKRHPLSHSITSSAVARPNAQPRVGDVLAPRDALALLADFRQRQMREQATGRGAVPVQRVGRDVHGIARVQHLRLFIETDASGRPDESATRSAHRALPREPFSPLSLIRPRACRRIGRQSR